MKPKHKTPREPENASPEQPTTESQCPAPTPEQIQKRAHEIFMARGGEPGRELDDWLLAERELKAGIERQKEQSAE